MFSAVSTIWVLLAAALVFFMQAGFAMAEAGFTRAKNTGNILMKNLMDFSLGSIVYWVMGFGIMFGTSTLFFGGFDFFTTGDYSSVLPEGVPLYAFLIFQTVFAATAATIVSGAMA
jgi:Amt family ammonium transporter